MAEPDDNPDELKRLCEINGADFQVLHCNRFDQQISLSGLRELIKLKTADWVIHTDSDEFLGQLSEIRNILNDMQAKKADYACAWMADRLTPDGHLRSIDDLKDYAELERAFPIRATVTKRLAKGCIFKNPLSRWPYIGNIHTPGKDLRHKAKRMLTLEHYKWRTGLEERLRKWIAHYKEVGLPYAPECYRLLDELRKHGRIRSEYWGFERLHQYDRL